MRRQRRGRWRYVPGLRWQRPHRRGDRRRLDRPVHPHLDAVDRRGVPHGGLFSTAFQFGAAIGLGIVAAVGASATDAGGDPQATLDGYRIGLLVPVAGALLALAITLPGLRSTFAAA
jgi:hypothetical protein